MEGNDVPRLSVGVRKMLWEIFCATFSTSAKWLDEYREPVKDSGEALAVLKGKKAASFWREVVATLRLDVGGRANKAKDVFIQAAGLLASGDETT